MCRSIKTLRPPYVDVTTENDVHAAALQYVRKISGFRAPSARNASAFDEAVAQVAAVTQHLLDSLQLPAGSRRTAPAVSAPATAFAPAASGVGPAGAEPSANAGRP